MSLTILRHLTRLSSNQMQLLLTKMSVMTRELSHLPPGELMDLSLIVKQLLPPPPLPKHQQQLLGLRKSGKMSDILTMALVLYTFGRS